MIEKVNPLGYIYMTTDLINNKFYIGRHTSPTLDTNYFGSAKVIRDLVYSLGKDNFKVEILEWCFTKDELLQKEIKWIEQFDAVNDERFYNTISASCGPLYHTDASRKKISNYLKSENNPSKRPEVREKIRQSKLGKNNPMYGKHLSEDTKLTLANKGKSGLWKHTEESKEKMRQAKLGKPSKRKKPVTIYGVTYPSLTEALNTLKISLYQLYRDME